MFENLSTLQLLILSVVSIGIFIFLLFLLIPGKEEKENKRFRPTIPASKMERGSLANESDWSLPVAIISEKIDQLSKKLEDYIEVVKSIERVNSERAKKYELNLVKLNQIVERIEPLLSQVKIGTTSGADKEALMKLAEKITLLEEKMVKPVAGKTEIEEVKDRLNEVITILKTLGS